MKMHSLLPPPPPSFYLGLKGEILKLHDLSKANWHINIRSGTRNKISKSLNWVVDVSFMHIFPHALQLDFVEKTWLYCFASSQLHPPTVAFLGACLICSRQIVFQESLDIANSALWRWLCFRPVSGSESGRASVLFRALPRPFPNFPILCLAPLFSLQPSLGRKPESPIFSFRKDCLLLVMVFCLIPEPQARGSAEGIR